jgi:uncharacterized membrane protein YdbT with pleckstrin-like domain
MFIVLPLACAYFGDQIAMDASDSTPWHRVLLGGTAAVALVLFTVIVYRHYCRTYTVYEDVIESRRGIIGRNVRSIRIRDLRNVNVRQSGFERIFGIGDVEFSSAGGPGIEVSFDGVKRPLEVKRLVQDRQNAVESGY